MLGSEGGASRGMMPIGGWWPGGRCGLGFAVGAVEQRGRFRFGQRVSGVSGQGRGRNQDADRRRQSGEKKGVKVRNGQRWAGMEVTRFRPGWAGADAGTNGGEWRGRS